MSTKVTRAELDRLGILVAVKCCCYRELGNGTAEEGYGYVCDYHEGVVDGRLAAEDLAAIERCEQ